MGRAPRRCLAGRTTVPRELRRRRWRDGTTHFVFDPLTFIERLAALVPRPREHQLTYHGVLAPASSWRDLIVPPGPPASGEPPAGLAAGVAPTPSEVLDSALGPTNVPPLLAAPVPRPDDPPSPSSSSPRRYAWSELMRRVFAIDVLACPTVAAGAGSSP